MRFRHYEGKGWSFIFWGFRVALKKEKGASFFYRERGKLRDGIGGDGERDIRV